MNDEVRNRGSGPPANEPGRRSDRKRLREKSLLTSETEQAASEAPDVEALRTLVEKVNCQGAPYQSVAVAAVQVLERALYYERRAAEAALSLGQQEKLKSMVKVADQAVSILRDTLNPQGHKVMTLCARQCPSTPEAEAQSSGEPWWFVLTNALEVLEEGTEQMTSLTTGQPPDSPARSLSELVARLLRGHHDALLLEAEEWIS
jgi:hypothetical protein